jgi:hypothetical protein
MQRNPAPRSRLRALVALLAVAWLAGAAAAAGAAAPDATDSAAEIRQAQIERWKGRFCTRAGCVGVPASAWGNAVGFGATILITGWIARRQPTP